jgi:hypothetical protein
MLKLPLKKKTQKKKTKLARAFSAEELVRLPFLSFRHLRLSIQVMM